jgi:hypothetical protein
MDRRTCSTGIVLAGTAVFVVVTGRRCCGDAGRAAAGGGAGGDALDITATPGTFSMNTVDGNVREPPGRSGPVSSAATGTTIPGPGGSPPPEPIAAPTSTTSTPDAPRTAQFSPRLTCSPPMLLRDQE